MLGTIVRIDYKDLQCKGIEPTKTINIVDWFKDHPNEDFTAEMAENLLRSNGIVGKVISVSYLMNFGKWDFTS